MKRRVAHAKFPTNRTCHALNLHSFKKFLYIGSKASISKKRFESGSDRFPIPSAPIVVPSIRGELLLFFICLFATLLLLMPGSFINRPSLNAFLSFFPTIV